LRFGVGEDLKDKDMKLKLISVLFVGLCLGFVFGAANAAVPLSKLTSAKPVEISQQKQQKKEAKQAEAKQAEVAKPPKKELSATALKNVKGQFDKINQEIDNPKPDPDWLKKISISGLMNIDLNNETKPNFNTKQENKLSLATTKLNFDAKVNDWVSGRIGLFYSNRTSYYYPASSQADNTGVDVEEAYVTIANFARTPFYFRAGKQYLPFGNYNRYPVLRSLTQQLSEIRETAMQLGFVDESGFYGSAYTFNGATDDGDQGRDRLNDYGAALGYASLNTKVRFDLSINYLNNMADVGAIYNNLNDRDYYTDRVGALGLNADIMTGPFDLAIRYVTALQHFSATDFAYQPSLGVTEGAKPKAASIKAGYQFESWGKQSKIHAGYQWSSEAYNVNSSATALQIPKYRIEIGYGVDLIKHVILVFDVDRDRDYSTDNGGTGAYNYIATARLTVVV
jgi:hypothetical protein